VLWVKKMISDC